MKSAMRSSRDRQQMSETLKNGKIQLSEHNDHFEINIAKKLDHFKDLKKSETT